MQRLKPEECLLAVIDVQERFVKVMPPERMQQLQRGVLVLLEAAEAFGVPVLWSEQYPKGLGVTIEPLRTRLEAVGAQHFEKTAFSACGAKSWVEALEAHAPKQVIVVGMEAHVCVYQTVRDLRARQLEVWVPIDAIVSRRDDHREAGLSLCEAVGALRSTSESVVFDWLQSADSEHFRRISSLLK